MIWQKYSSVIQILFSILYEIGVISCRDNGTKSIKKLVSWKGKINIVFTKIKMTIKLTINDPVIIVSSVIMDLENPGRFTYHYFSLHFIINVYIWFWIIL